MIFEAVSVICLVGLGYGIMMLLRNPLVSLSRIAVIDAIAECNLEDLRHGCTDVSWRWRQFQNGPSYYDMMYAFWKRPSSFFTDPATWTKD